MKVIEIIKQANKKHFNLTYLLSMSIMMVVCLNLMPLHATNITVQNTLNAGPGSLRDAVSVADVGDTITFASDLNGDTIKLTGSAVTIDKRLTILGNGPAQTILDGQENGNILFILDTLILKDVTIQNGRRFDSGGGVFNSGHLTMTNCWLRANKVFSEFSLAAGGGFYNTGNAYVFNCIISDNIACSGPSQGWGGGITNFGDLTLVSSIISGNEAIGLATDKGSSGGGIYSPNNSTLTILNCLIAGNLVRGDAFAQGGGVSAFGASEPINVSIVNSTITGNKTISSTFNLGGGIYKGGQGSFAIANSIVAANFDGGSHPDIYKSGTDIVDGGYNLIGDTTGTVNQFPLTTLKGSTANPIDPLFIEGVDTSMLPTSLGNMRLQQNSPAINMGTWDTTGLNLPMYDLDGLDRIKNSRVDIGVYENPYSGCAANQIIDPTYSPLNGLYEAVQSITLGQGIVVASPNNVVLSSVTSNLLPGVEIMSGGVFTIVINNCSQ